MSRFLKGEFTFLAKVIRRIVSMTEATSHGGPTLLNDENRKLLSHHLFTGSALGLWDRVQRHVLDVAKALDESL